MPLKKSLQEQGKYTLKKMPCSLCLDLFTSMLHWRLFQNVHGHMAWHCLTHPVPPEKTVQVKDLVYSPKVSKNLSQKFKCAFIRKLPGVSTTAFVDKNVSLAYCDWGSQGKQCWLNSSNIPEKKEQGILLLILLTILQSRGSQQGQLYPREHILLMPGDTRL